MAFGGYVYQGFQDRSDELDNQRMKTAKAFEEFKKANPYATTQELRDAVDQFAGSSPYLRSGAATEETIRDIAVRNAENNYARERELYMKNHQARKTAQEDLNESIYGFYEQSGDINLAIKNAQSQLQALNPQNGFQSDQLKRDMDYLAGLDEQVIEDEFIQKYFDKNKNSIMSQINAGTPYDQYKEGRGQPILGTTAFQSRYDAEFAPVLERNEQAAFDKLVSLMSDQNYVNMAGTGNLEPIKKALGRFSGFIDDATIRQYAEDQAIASYQAKRSGTLDAGRVYAKDAQSANNNQLNDQLSVIGNDLSNSQSKARLMAFASSQNYTNPNAVIALTDAIYAEGKDITPEQMTKILSEYKNNNGFMDDSAYRGLIMEQFMNDSGVGEKPTTQTDFVMDAFGDGGNDKGKVGEQLAAYEDNVKKLLQPTVDFIPLRKHQSRHGESDYANHTRAITSTISELIDRREQIINMASRAETTDGWLPTVNEDFNRNRDLARTQAQNSVAQIDALIEQLRQKKADVDVEAETAIKRQQGLATSNDFLPGSATLNDLARYVQGKGYAQALKSGQIPQNIIDDIMREAGLSSLAYKNAYGGMVMQPNSAFAASRSGQYGGSYTQSSVFPNQNNGPDYNTESQAIIDALTNML